MSKTQILRIPTATLYSEMGSQASAVIARMGVITLFGVSYVEFTADDARELYDGTLHAYALELVRALA